MSNTKVMESSNASSVEVSKNVAKFIAGAGLTVASVLLSGAHHANPITTIAIGTAIHTGKHLIDRAFDNER